MNNLGGPEFLFLILLGLLVFGPRRLPELSRQVGGFVGQLRRAWKQAQTNIEREVALEDVRKIGSEVRELKTDARRMAREWIEPVPDPVPEPGPEPGTAPTDAAEPPDAPGAGADTPASRTGPGPLFADPAASDAPGPPDDEPGPSR